MLESPSVPHSADFDEWECKILDAVRLPYASAQEVRYARSFLGRVRMNSAIRKNRYWVFPVDDNGHENFVPVGRGVKSSSWCGRWVSELVCRHTDLHEGKVVGGTDCTGKVVVKHQHLWCNKSSCPVCFISGWSVRQARAIESRINEGVRLGLGKPEHITVSPPVCDRGLPEPVMKERCRLALLDRGVSGGNMIFHGYRIDRKRAVLVWSPHYHTLGFIKGGFDRCRECVHDWRDCRGCSAFKGREVRGFERDGYLVKVLAPRKTVFGTAHYELNHATIKLGIKRFHVVSWFGSCSYHKFRSQRVHAEVRCPACDSVMVKSVYVGKVRRVKDLGSIDYVPVFVDDEFDGDAPNYVDVGGGHRG